MGTTVRDGEMGGGGIVGGCGAQERGKEYTNTGGTIWQKHHALK